MILLRDDRIDPAGQLVGEPELSVLLTAKVRKIIGREATQPLRWRQRTVPPAGDHACTRVAAIPFDDFGARFNEAAIIAGLFVLENQLVISPREIG
jgi:hypothetical protein